MPTGRATMRQLAGVGECPDRAGGEREERAGLAEGEIGYPGSAWLSIGGPTEAPIT